MNYKHVVSLLLGCLWLLSGTAFGAKEIKDLETRPGVKQRFILLRNEQPVASLILFAGRNGKLGIGSEGSLSAMTENFLVRTASKWVDQGFSVAIVDAPSDRQGGEGLDGFRQRPEHAQDISAVIAFLREQAPVPVWLVGTSRGTTSAAFCAMTLKEKGPDGVVLTSSITTGAGNLPAMKLNAITVPVLVVHNEYDGCKVTPFAEVPKIMSGLASSRKAELKTFKSSYEAPPQKAQTSVDQCGGLTGHGFYGIEAQVVMTVSEWIKAQRGAAKPQ